MTTETSVISVVLSLNKVELKATHRVLFPWSEGVGRPPWTEIPMGREPSLEGDPLVLISSDNHCSGRYASYWNAFLFGIILDENYIKKNKLH